MNLNELIWDYDHNHDFKEVEYAVDRSPQKSQHGNVTIESFFSDIEGNLIKKIKKFEDGIILGCIAWMTNEKIITALSKVKNVSIIVQKEDFLRPDYDRSNGDKWAKKIRSLYSMLSCDLSRYSFHGKASKLSVCYDPTIQPVRCMGNHNSNKSPAFPRCHHKFLVFCEVEQPEESEFSLRKIVPKAVWTGSFNFSHNSTNSLENAIYIESPDPNHPIINQYLMEHHFIYGLSEPLDWKKPWVAPEYRLGT